MRKQYFDDILHTQTIMFLLGLSGRLSHKNWFPHFLWRYDKLFNKECMYFTFSSHVSWVSACLWFLCILFLKLLCSCVSWVAVTFSRFLTFSGLSFCFVFRVVPPPPPPLILLFAKSGQGSLRRRAYYISADSACPAQRPAPRS